MTEPTEPKKPKPTYRQQRRRLLKFIAHAGRTVGANSMRDRNLEERVRAAKKRIEVIDGELAAEREATKQ